MFGLFKKDKKKELEALYAKKLEAAVHAQRNGKIELYAELTTESEEILKKIEELEKQASKN
jgi:molybdenum-dependent DNA-binding transcriptional regulator ModE